MSYRERIILVSLFSNGLIVCLAGALRTYYAWIQDGSFDKTWDAFPLWIVSMVEVNIFYTTMPPRKANPCVKIDVSWAGRLHLTLIPVVAAIFFWFRFARR